MLAGMTVTATALMIIGVLLLYFHLAAGHNAQEEARLAEETIQATEPVETSPYAVTGDGNPASLLYSESYTVSAEEAEKYASQVVAACAGQKLTNAQLQVLYLSQIASFRAAPQEAMPDFNEPLEHQLCPLGEGNLSWQHYFLKRALDSWQAQQALLKEAREPQIIPEEAFQPNFYQDLHTPNITPDLPVNNFLYSDKDCYTPNKLHQAYLDNTEAMLEALAKEKGFEDLQDYTKTLYAGTIDVDTVVDAAVAFNKSYMYFTEKSYYAEVPQEELDKILDGMPEDEDYTADFRHILLIPEDAEIAADGTVTAEEAQWKRCREQAETMIKSWLNSYPTHMIENGKNINFSRLAYENSQDPASSENGGLYTRVRPGQLIEPLNEWVFHKDREPNDYEVIQSELGLHIVFFIGLHSETEEAVRESMLHHNLMEQWQGLMDKATLKPHFDVAALWVDVRGDAITREQILYPDVAHERYPEAMVFLQQDYATTRYGSSTVGRGGCGITTMAMLATYMTDELTTPAMLAKDYYKYHDENGTMAEMFLYVPAELGFQLDRRTHSVDEICQALLDGNRVVSLQVLGHFTGAGHYLLLQEYFPETDTFQIRDSNIANYGKLEGHKVDYFTRFNLTSGGTNFFIFQDKVVSNPLCIRCGGEAVKQTPLTGEFTCPKCVTAMSRRMGFMNIHEELISR